jgi:soluble lytic murein transglycosylase-like protein
MKIPSYAQSWPWPAILEASELYGIGWEMLGAIIQTESSGNQFAYRYEPKFNYLHDTNILQNLWKCTNETALIMQKSSYGYTQVMGATAIDLGLLKLNEKHVWPTLLFRTDINLKFCCLLLKQKFKKYGEKDMATIYASYNAGTAKKNDKGIFMNEWAVAKFRKNYQEFLGNSNIEYIEINPRRFSNEF